jgi:type I pantothenate kinase
VTTAADLAAAVAERRGSRQTLVVGVTGSVAVGKTVLAGTLAAALAERRLSVTVAATDGFLRSNAELKAAGLTLRKGFPETYDLAALAAALASVRTGPTRFPNYSHLTYDVDPQGGEIIDRPQVLIVEGLALGLDRPPGPGLIDCLIYVDAPEALIEAWFVERFLGLWRAARGDPSSFYARFLDLDLNSVTRLAGGVWREINLANLRAHIAPVRALADLVVVKGEGHRLERLIAADR